MSQSEKLPDVYIITPVFNASSVLKEYFAGISILDYPKNKLHLIMPDGGSTDATTSLCLEAGALVIDNPLKTGEAGKAIGVKRALQLITKAEQDDHQSLICLLDSDNFITRPDWLNQLVQPLLDDPAIIGSEPLEYLYRQSDSLITRYCALMGMSDPIMLWLGNYDRYNQLTKRWTGLDLNVVDQGNYLAWQLDLKKLPTIGANGTIFRAELFKTAKIGDYLFDIEVLYQYLNKRPAKFAKVKVGIVHAYCNTTAAFKRKQQRRIQDFNFYERTGQRQFWSSNLNYRGLAKFILCTVTVLPLLYQVMIGYRRVADRAWWYHPIACWITLWIYASNRIGLRFKTPAIADRQNWRQGA